MRDGSRAWLLWCAPLLVAGCFLAPLIVGGKTLFFRDVGNFHWPAKLEQSRTWAAGEVPHIDRWRGGGQPGIGNPNVTPFYPTNLLLRGDAKVVLWGFNAHFWLHLLLAPILMAGWLNGMGLRSPATWVGAATFGSSGFVVSTLGFHNLVPYTVWIPALLWSVVACARARGAARAALATVAVSVSWAALLLGGDPTSALLAVLAAIACVAFLMVGCDPDGSRSSIGAGGVRRNWLHAGWPLLALLPGSLMAWPQIAALLGSLDGSMRGALGYSADGVLRGSWHPALGLDLLFPFALGFPDGGFWGQRFHGEAQPLLFTFFPGAAALLLALAGAGTGERYRQRWLGLFLVGAGALVALGGYNPVVGWLARSGGLSWLRFPVKAWWWVALGTAVLVALAVDRLLPRPEDVGRAGRDCQRRRARLGRCAGIAGGLWLGSGLIFTGLSFVSPGWLERWVAHPLAPRIVEESLRRQAVAAALAGITLLLLVWTLRRPTNGRWALWIAMFFAVQLTVLRPLFPMLDREEVLRPVAPYSVLQEGARVVHGPLDLGWETPAPQGVGGVESASAQQRRLNRQGVPMVGVASGGRFLLNTSPDGLDNYLPGAVRQLLRQAPRGEQVKLLPRLGATHVVATGPDGSMQLVPVGGSFGPVFSSRWARSGGITDTLGRLSADVDAEASRQDQDAEGPERRSELIVVADDLGELLAESFGQRDERSAGGVAPAAPSRSRVLRDEPRGSVIEVEAAADGWLMLDRAWLPRYRALIDGVPVRTSIANALRLAVPVPQGARRVEVRYETRSWEQRWLFVGTGLITLVLMAWVRFRTAARARP